MTNNKIAMKRNISVQNMFKKQEKEKEMADICAINKQFKKMV